MRRRAFVGSLAAAPFWLGTALAQQPSRQRRVGVLTGFREDDPTSQARIQGFRDKLRSLGWTEGGNLILETRFAGTQPHRIGVLAREIVEQAPDVILVQSYPGLVAVNAATKTIPTVFVQVAVNDPIVEGLVKSYSRPGVNMTGFTNFEDTIAAKWLQLLVEIAPSVTRACVVMHSESAGAQEGYLQEIQKAADQLGREVVPVRAAEAAQIEHGISAFAREKPNGGLVVLPSNLTAVNRNLIFELAQQHRLPSMSAFRYMAESGGLASYGVDVVELFRSAGNYVDRILRGTSPSELPIQQPTKYEFVLNRRAARGLGLDFPEVLVSLADDVLE